MYHQQQAHLTSLSRLHIRRAYRKESLALWKDQTPTATAAYAARLASHPAPALDSTPHMPGKQRRLRACGAEEEGGEWNNMKHKEKYKNTPLNSCIAPVNCAIVGRAYKCTFSRIHISLHKVTLVRLLLLQQSPLHFISEVSNALIWL